MSAVTITITDECKDVFTAFKLRHKHKYVLFEIDGDSFELKIVKKGRKKATHEEFTKLLPKTEARYALYDLKYKAYMVCWTPKAASSKDKVFYTSQRGKLVKTFTGVKAVSGTTVAELEANLGFDDESDSDDEEWDPDA